MVETEGLTSRGVERKAALRAFFSKLLFLTEQVELLVTPEAVKEAGESAASFIQLLHTLN
jgi:hypothetical protein